jgi:hypothetical protein
MGYSQIPVKDETKERLEELGEFGETWDDLVNRLLDERDD